MVLYQFTWFDFKISILGISAAVSIFLLYGAIYFVSKKNPDIIQSNKIADLIISVGVFTIFFSRFVYIAFNWTYYTVESQISNEVIKIWHGGFSSSGAIVGFLLSYWAVAYTLNIKSLYLIDHLSPMLMISFFILGSGNFLNQKIQEDNKVFFVENSDVALIDIINDHTILENADILYESWAYLLAGLLLLRLKNRGFSKGFIFGCFILLFSIIRFVFSNISSSITTGEYYATHLITISSFSIAMALILGLKLFLKTEIKQKENFAEKQNILFND
jgi:prolipoprotein diacylglyceryltransferase